MRYNLMLTIVIVFVHVKLPRSSASYQEDER